MKILNLAIFASVLFLISATVAGAAYYKPTLRLAEDAPYIPSDLSYTPITGGIVTINMLMGEVIASKVSSDHIDVYTTAKYRDFEYKAGENVSIPLFFEFFSDTKNVTTMIINPSDSFVGLRCMQSLGPGRGGIVLNDYVSYSQNGIITLPVGQIVNVTMTINVLAGLWPYPEPTSIPFNLLGIDSSVFMVERFRGDIYL